MTTFEKDLQDALEGNEKEVITRRRSEINKLVNEGKGCKNSFKRTCIAQKVAELTAELNIITSNF